MRFNSLINFISPLAPLSGKSIRHGNGGPSKGLRIHIAEWKDENAPFSSHQLIQLLKKELREAGCGAALSVTHVHRRFPMEKDAWERLVARLPDGKEELLGAIETDLLLWIELPSSDQQEPQTSLVEEQGFRICAWVFAKVGENHLATPAAFAKQRFGPFKTDISGQLSPFIALFVVAQLWPALEAYSPETLCLLDILYRKIALRLDEQSAQAPPDFAFDLKRLSTWALAHLGKALKDEEKMARAQQSFESLLESWPDDRSRFDYAQIWANLARLRLALGKYHANVEQLEQAIDAVEEALLIYNHGWTPWAWASLHFIKADALLMIGRQQNDLIALEEAAGALKNVMTIWQREQVPSQWVIARTKLGHVLQAIGQRSGGTDRLEQAVMAYRSALESGPYARLPKHPPKHFIETKKALAETLLIIGKRAGKEQCFAQAVVFLRDLLEARQTGETLFERSQIRIQMGHALTLQGKAQGECAPLKEAVILLREALKELQSQKMDPEVETGKNVARTHLGSALAALGKAEHQIKYLSEAATFLQSTVDLSDEIPGTPEGDVAYKLGDIYASMAEMGGGTENFHAAVGAYKKALKTCDPEDPSRRSGLIQHRLGRLFTGLAKRQNGTAKESFEEAIAAYHQALDVLEQNQSPLLWAQIQNELAEVLTMSAHVGGGAPHLHQAALAYGKALEEWTPKSSPQQCAKMLTHLGNVLADLGFKEKNGDHLYAAKKAFSEAYDIYATHESEEKAGLMGDNLERIEEAISKMRERY